MQIQHKLSYQELVSCLRLIRTQHIGPSTFSALIKIYKTCNNVLEALPELIKKSKAYDKINTICSIETAEQEIENTYKIGGRIITVFDEDYPENLRNIHDYPPVLTILGDISLLKQKIIAIVGSRNPSINGKNFAYKLSYELANSGFTIVSGLAKGIDKSAHSIIFKQLPTIAIMGNGINIVYPEENTTLYNAITDNGGLIATEFPFATLPKAQLFPQRNRIISGLSLGVVIVEASMKSGSLITANFAIHQNREVFAVPGSPFDYRCKGSNYLIKTGSAKLIEHTNDIIESLQFNTYNYIQHSLFDNIITNYQSTTEIDNAKNLILQHITHSPVEIEEIITSTNLSISTTLIALMELETSHKIERLPNNKVMLIHN
ncbi:DNA-protecting protein DprA [Ehrlichia ruminantium]|uniref:DNA-processing protein DprA n=1 Tax=Ehrlichia ruminantium TaxID=779 RepID=UPI0007A0A9BE|nr:DNA-processing protein DprA [Ehrlichia ruminantium]KYW90979.1 DNA processing protein DprA [Ehrlichia ruminantium]QLK50292.1 DNA-protecting protein DprA [Ehrlichia ruminantium]QLK51216.1 DNA-protecting protein DprA [Ehrlichia ruminantium]QLK53051.1 DNA-protecting protein DprA [Ehrlichia ruminantium]QLK58553.1 DNA-protecting protein DprA [Ehrlichia ruminantium]